LNSIIQPDQIDGGCLRTSAHDLVKEKLFLSKITSFTWLENGLNGKKNANR